MKRLRRWLAVLLAARVPAAAARAAPARLHHRSRSPTRPRISIPGVGLDEAVAEDPPAALQLAARRSTPTCASCPIWPSGSRRRIHRRLWRRFRRGVLFHDGREMTAADVAFTFRRFLDPASSRAARAPTGSGVGRDRRSRTRSRFTSRRRRRRFRSLSIMGIVPDGHGRRRPRGGRSAAGRTG